MAKKPNVSHYNSVVGYNHELRDVKNKKIRLLRHVKKHPNDKIDVTAIVTNYMTIRKKTYKNVKPKVKVKRKKSGASEFK